MTTMTPGANIPISASRLVVEITAPKALDVSGLLLTAAGKVRSDADFVFFNQPSGPGVTHRPASPGAPDAITVDTSAVPGGIDTVVVTASVDGGGPFSGCEPTATVRDAASGTVIATFTPPRLQSETALIVVEVYRRQGAWKLRAVGQGYADGLAGIATDFGVTVDDAPAPSHTGAPSPAPVPTPQPQRAPAPQPPQPPQSPSAPMPPAPTPAPGGGFGPPPGGYGQAPTPPAPPQAPMPPYVPMPPAPSYGGSPSAPPAPPMPAAPGTPGGPGGQAGAGPINLDKGRVTLRKNETVSLVKAGRPMLSVVRMGLGWEPAYGGRSIDLDASVIAYDGRRKKVDNAWFMKLAILGGAIQHSGDNLTGEGAGDDEVITVDLGRVPPEVSGLVFVVNSFSGQKFTEIAKAYCRLLDGHNNAELVRFDLTNSEPRTGVIMCKLVRQRSGEWHMTAVGKYVEAKTVRGMVKPAAGIL